MHAKSAVTAALALFASSVVAQANDTDIDISAIDVATKSSWCNAEYDSCNFLCGSVIANSCDSTSLSYNCTCTNGSAPGLQYYIQTVPTFLCEEEYQQCIAANLQSQSGQDECKKTEKAECGHLDPGKVVLAAPSSSSASATTTAHGATDTASPAETTVASSTSLAAAAVTKLAFGPIVAGVAVAMML